MEKLHGKKYFPIHAVFLAGAGFIFIGVIKMDLCELLHKAGQDNRVAQNQVYDLYAKKMFLLCRQYTKDDESAREILIDGFLRFFRRLAGFRYVNEAATYEFVKKIMLNECLRRLSKSTTVFLVITEELPGTELHEEVIAQLSAKEIYTLIANLPLGYRTIFNLVHIEDKTHKEIAAALNISEKTSQTQYLRARHMLQEMLIQMSDDYESRKRKYNKKEAE